MAAPVSDRHWYNIVFTIPRTSSHLLIQILNLPAQDSIHRHPSDGYFFLAPLVQRFKHHLAGKDVSSWSEEQQEAVKDAFQESWEGLAKFLETAKKSGKGVFVKDHINWLVDPIAETRFLHPPTPRASRVPNGIPPPDPPGNPFAITVHDIDSPTLSPRNETVLPDDVLAGLRPTFLIRNPMLTFPSLLRTSLDNEGRQAVIDQYDTQRWELTFHWSRALYEFYLNLQGYDRTTSSPDIQYPIILDADDLLDENLMRRYASAIHLDPDLVRYTWPAATSSELDALSKTEKRMKSTILGSEGIVQGKTSQGLVLDEEVVKWKKEFGDELGERLDGFVKDAMEDYWWLWEKRLKA
jgi:hypothetical protein